MNTTATSKRPSLNTDLKIVIPARLASTRLPRKPLQLLGGRPMIERTYRRALEAELGEVVVTTDSEEIAECIRAIGGQAHLTTRECHCGTDRIGIAAQELHWADETPIINLQCDEPGIPLAGLRKLASSLRERRADMCTLAAPLVFGLAHLPQHVKVVVDARQRALYFSRAAIPYSRDDEDIERLHHIGVYAYTVQTLKRFVALPVCEAERSERLEQLRALHHGMSIHVEPIDAPPFSGIDTAEDLAAAQRHFER